MAKTATCANCGSVEVYATFRDGRPGWRCREAVRADRRRAKPRDRERARLRRHLRDACERCGFEPQHMAQLEIHHRDRDRTNNDPSNLETVCANCHRLEHV